MDKLFHAPEKFSFDGPDVAPRWTRWEKEFRTYFIACEIKKKPKEVQVAILLNCAGPEAQEVHEQFTFETDDERKDVDKVLEKFGEYCRPRKHVVFERYKFWCRDQQGEEPVDKWVKDLRTIANNCEFGDQESSLLRDKIVFGVRDDRTKERMLRDADLTLQKALDACRAAESTKVQMREMTNTAVEDKLINEVKHASAKSNNRNHQRDRQLRSNEHNTDHIQCFNCNEYGHYSRECPNGDSFPQPRRSRGRSNVRGNRGGRRRGRGRGRNNHYINEVQEGSEGVSPDDMLYEDQFQCLSLNSIDVEMDGRGRSPTRGNRGGRSPGKQQGHTTAEEKYAQQFETLHLHSVTVDSLSGVKRKTQRFARFKFHNFEAGKYCTGPLKVDSGAGINTMPIKEYQRLYPDRFTTDGKPIDSYIIKDRTRLTGYGGQQVEHIGYVTLPCEYNGRKFKCDFYLADVTGPSLLGLPTGEALDIIKINVVDAVFPEEGDGSGDEDDAAPESSTAAYIDPSSPVSSRPAISSKADLQKMYPECFEQNKRCFPNYEYDISVDPTIKPSVKPVRRIPIELKEDVQKELQRMVELGVIVPVKKPTEWVNAMVVEHKANGKLRICLDPTNLNKAIRREHYPSPHLDDLTHRLAGSDTYTKLDAKDGYWNVKLSEKSSYLTTFNTPWGRFRYTVLAFGLKMSQDVFQMKQDEAYAECNGIIGKADDITVYGKGNQDHDTHLHEAMEASRAANITLNYKKIEFKKPAVKFFGNVYSKDGVQADPDKVKSIVELRRPEDKSELRTFLGTVGRGSGCPP